MYCAGSNPLKNPDQSTYILDNVSDIKPVSPYVKLPAI
jgi:hypothetical protein